jgi:hypothetical protein
VQHLSRCIFAAITAALGTIVVAAAALAAPADPAPLLPDLVQERPKDLGVVEAGGEFRLGFWSGVSNTGAAPLVIEGARASRSTPHMTATQVVPNEALGPMRRADVGTLEYVRLRGHRHWHLQDFERYELRRADGKAARPSRKTGFCLGDRYDAARSRRLAGEPLRPPYGGLCGIDRPDLLRISVGISVGFGDDYDPQLEGQYVDVTGLPAGRYVLVHRVNPERRLLETRYDNNTSCLSVTLRWPRGPRVRPAIRSDPTFPCTTTTTSPRQEVGQ